MVSWRARLLISVVSKIDDFFAIFVSGNIYYGFSAFAKDNSELIDTEIKSYRNRPSTQTQQPSLAGMY